MTAMNSREAKENKKKILNVPMPLSFDLGNMKLHYRHKREEGEVDYLIQGGHLPSKL
jgi:hypothetical protein